MASMPMRSARWAAATKASRICAMPSKVSSVGGGSEGSCGRGEGPTVSQPPCWGDSNCPPAHGTALEALRPAWANWIHTTVAGASARARARVLANAASVRSSHRPRQAGVMRPSGSTAVASMVNSAAPLLNRLPQCMRCQSVASPLTAEYWHMGATTMRLGRVRPPRGEGKNWGVKSRLMRGCSLVRNGVAGAPWRDRGSIVHGPF